MKKLESFVPMIVLMVTQFFITLVLYLMCNFISFFTGYVVGGLITFLLYALIWWFIWLSQYGKDGISQFYPKLICTTIPLITYTLLYISFHPAPNYTMMIPLLPEQIHFDFSTAVTSTLLFPLYSVVLMRYFFPRNHSLLRFVVTGSALVLIGAVIFISCYSFLPTEW